MTKLSILLIFSTTVALSQADTIEKDTSVVLVELFLKNGKKMEGVVLDRSREFLTFKTINSDTIQIAPDQILGIVSVTQNKIIDLQLPIFENQFGYKYFLTHSAVPVPPKKWYYSNYYILFSNFNYGISKRLSAGMTCITFNPLALFSPKLKFTFNPDSKVKFAINAQYLYVRVWDSSNGYEGYNNGFFQAIATRGSAQNNFTIGIGKFISQGGVEQGYIATLALVKKVSPKLSFITENNLLIRSKSSYTWGLLSAGVRFNRKNHAFDLGILAPAIIGRPAILAIPIPFISYNLRLSR